MTAREGIKEMERSFIRFFRTLRIEITSFFAFVSLLTLPEIVFGQEPRLEISSISNIQAAEKSMREVFDRGDCEAAIKQSTDLSEKTKVVISLVDAAMIPLTNQNSIDVGNVSLSAKQYFSANRTLLRKLKNTTALSLTIKAECLAKINERNGAARAYTEAISYISPSETELWKRARAGIYNIIGFYDEPLISE
ncbi:hypothetical protein [Pararhodospirillum photometricum]|uniref:hypothetical protein n=1 Tax=Pararhodospirillum photometricum TaxID=1084 RepID=UPI0012FEB656|nr:hypothetical protein [Pararhodospirillum photometricum]